MRDSETERKEFETCMALLAEVVCERVVALDRGIFKDPDPATKRNDGSLAAPYGPCPHCGRRDHEMGG